MSDLKLARANSAVVLSIEFRRRAKPLCCSKRRWRVRLPELKTWSASFRAAAIGTLLICVASGTPVMARGGFMHGMGGFSMHGGHRVGAGGTEGIVNQLHASIHYLSIINGIASVVRTGLLDRTLDLIITNDPMDDADGIVRHPILSESYVVVVPRTGATLPLTDLTALGRKLPLIRSHPRSRTGMDIERQLRRMGVNIERRFEFDSSAAILSMVSSGFGWAIMPPLSIFEIRPLLRHVRVVPFPGRLFSRQLHLFARADELEATAKRIALMSRKILRERYLPELLKIGSWLNGQIVVDNT